MTDKQSPSDSLLPSSEEAERLAWTTYESPVGLLTVLASAAGICSLRFPGHGAQLTQTAHRRMPDVAAQLADYFAGERQDFELQLDLRGTPFQRHVWEQLLQIPYGTTTTYGELARRIDESLYPIGLQPYRRARLVGAAIGRTPTPILVPCHRVIGADGSLTGYGGGLQRKRTLLELEGALAAEEPAPTNRASRQLALL
jgi:methylated-DNA-[protein]-cysteine S-methyltransferase